MSDDVRINTSGLDKILKALGGKLPVARVGILGDKSVRGESPKSGEKKSQGLNNATLGAYHEYGLGNNPQRSFLRVPISENLDKRLQAIGALDKSYLESVIKKGSLVELANLLGIEAVGIVTDAFDSGGFGKWKPSDMSEKKNHQTLVETQQLRNSITYEVKE